jgi:small nuclear ribonucleoprotein (snRNP)-like protein
MSTPSNTITVCVAPLIKEESVSPVLLARSLSPETEQWYQTVQEHGLFNGALTAAELDGANVLLGLANGKPGPIPIKINIANNFIKVNGQVYTMDPYCNLVLLLASYKDSDSELASLAYPTTLSNTTASSPCSPHSIGELNTFDGRFRFGLEEQPAPTPEQLRSPGCQAALMAYDVFANPTPHILFYTTKEEAAIVCLF